MLSRLTALLSALGVLALFGASPATAASLTWTGVLKVIVEDTTAGTYTGGVPDVSVFSGSFSYGDACGGCLVEPFGIEETNYVFLGGTGSVTGLGIITDGVESSVAISNDEIIDIDEAMLFEAFGVIAPVGNTVDVWSVASETLEDPIDDNIEWEVAFVYLTTNPFSNTDYTATPPPNPDLVIFQIDDTDETNYFAFGEVTMVPEPLSAALVALGLGLLRLRGKSGAKATYA